MRKIRAIITAVCLISISTLISCDDVFEKDLSGKDITIIAPADTVSMQEGEVVFLWQSLEGARAYHITIVSPSFEKAERIIADSVMSVDSVGRGGLRFKKVLNEGEYQWRLSASNSGYKSNEITRSLTIFKKPEE